MFAVYATHTAPDDPLSALKIGESVATVVASHHPGYSESNVAKAGAASEKHHVHPGTNQNRCPG
jgi:hypothetical protein